MQKKVLIPLLMAPAAVPALANITMVFPENSHWTQNGATGDQNPWSSFDPNATEVTCTVGTGYITTTLELPAGKYKMYFVNQRNIYVKVDGETLKMNATGNYVEFQIKGNEGAQMEIGAADKSKGFEFSGKSMELVFNADAQVKDLQTKLAALKDIALEQVNENDLFKEANDLNTEKAEILKGLENYSSNTVLSTPFETVWSEIEKLDYATTSFKDAIDIYTKYGFNETPNAIDAYLTTLGKIINSYNEDVINETGVFALYQENLETRTALLGEQADLAKANAALLKEITDWTLDDSKEKASLLEKVQTQATALAKYKAEIETAFPYVEGDWEYNRSLREKITFNPTPNAEALTETNKSLQEEYNKFKADYEVYYQVNFELLTALKNAYDNYANVLGQASGVRGFDNVYDDIREKGFDELYLSEDAALKAYNDAKATYQIPEVTGAVETATKNNCVEGLQKVINNFKMLSEALAELVETQNNNMTEAQNTYSEYKTAIGEFEKMVVVDTYQEEFNSQLGVIKTDVEAFRDYYTKQYEAHTLDLTGEGYTTKTEGVETKIAALNEYVKPLAVINGLMEQLNAAKEVVAGLNDTKVANGTTLLENGVDVDAKWKTAFENIGTAIKNLTADNYNTATVIQPIEEAIKKTQEDAQEMAADFVSVINTVNTFKATVADFKTFVEQKAISEEKNTAVQALKKQYLDNYTGEQGEFTKEVNGYESELNKAKLESNGQNSWNLIDALQKKFTNDKQPDTFNAKVNEVKTEFAFKATTANAAYAQAEIEALEAAREKAIAEEVTNVKTDIPGTKIPGLFNKLNTLKKGIVDTATTDELQKIDADIIALLAEVRGVDATLKQLVTNQNTYNKMIEVLNNFRNVLAGVVEYNQATSVEPGVNWYANVLAGYGTQIDDLEAALLAALQDRTIVEKTGGFDGYGSQAQNIYQSIMDTRIAIDANNTKHNDQLVREKEVRTYIESLKSLIESDADLKALNESKGWTTTLVRLLDNDMTNVNIEVTNAYGKGESAVQNGTIMKHYDDIYSEAEKIEKAITGDALKEAVKDANTETTKGWATTITGLMDSYKAGIRIYNYFYYDVKNPGWKAFIHETVSRHETLFQFYGKINTLNEETLAKIQKWNDDNHVITESEWKDCLGVADAISASITTDVNELWTEVDELAATYYNKQKKETQDALTDATGALKIAGISLDYLKVAQGYFDLAVSLYKPGKEGHLAESMDAVSDEFDKVKPAIDLQQFAEDAWEKKYAAAVEEFNTLSEEIAGYIHATEEVKESAKISVANCQENMTILNTEVSQCTEGLIDKYKYYADGLDSYLAGMKELRDEVKQSNDSNVEDQNLQKQFDELWLPGMNDAYTALKTYCESLGGCAQMDTTLGNIREGIDLLVEKVKANAGNLVSIGLENKYNDIMNSITDAYKEAFDMEVQYLRGLVKDTEIAFNDAYAGGSNPAVLPEGETYDKIDATITAQEGGIEALPGKYDAADPDALQTEMIGYETELCRLYVMLQTAFSGENPATALLNELNKNYDELTQAIAAGKETLAGCMDSVQADFAGKYEALQSELDAEKTDWSDDADRIIARKGYYTKTLEEIKTALDTLNNKVALAEEKAQAEAEKQRVSNERYEALSAEYQALVKDFEDAKALVEGYGYDLAERYEGYANLIQSFLDESNAALEADRAAFALTAESTLLYGEEIKSYINTYKYQATKSLAAIELNATIDANNDAAAKLRELLIVPAVREVLEKEFIDANSQLSGLVDEWSYAETERLAEIAEESKTLAEKFASISKRAAENSYVLGDVDLDENGEVNVLDVQMLINFVGEGITYSQLYAKDPRQACAADINGNEVINIADVTSLIQMIVGDDVQIVRVKAHKAPVKSNDSLNVALIGEENGVRTYALTLSNSTPYTAAQFDIKASGDAVVTGIATTERTEGHDAYLYNNGLGESRVVLASMANSTFGSQDGTLVLIQVEGKGDLTISNAMFTDCDNNIHEISKAHTSTIDAIYDYVKDGAVRIYDAAGRRLQSIQRGINIIRHKDGKVTKEMRK